MADLDQKSLERVIELVRGLVDDDTSAEMRKKLIEFFHDGTRNAEKYAAFLEVSKDILPNLNPPTTELKQEYEALLEKLGLKYEEGDVSRSRTTKLKRRLVWQVAAVIVPLMVVLGAGYRIGWFDRNAIEYPDSPQLVAVNENDTEEQKETGNKNALVFEVISGVQKELTLPDSSTVWVNSASKLTFEEGAEHERIANLEGQAYFSVERDEQKPFIVHTKHLDVTVLGTQFDVMAYPDSNMTEVVLFEGSVEAAVANRNIKLKPNEKLTYFHDSGEIKVENINKFREWRADAIVIRGRTLADIFTMTANYYDVNIVFDKTKLNSDLYDITLAQKHPVDVLLMVLSKTSGEFTYRIDEQGKTIYIEVGSN